MSPGRTAGRSPEDEPLSDQKLDETLLNTVNLLLTLVDEHHLPRSTCPALCAVPINKMCVLSWYENGNTRSFGYHICLYKAYQ